MGNESKIQTSSDFMLHSQNVSVVPTVGGGGGGGGEGFLRRANAALQQPKRSPNIGKKNCTNENF